jgi:D-aminopeptidase
MRSSPPRVGELPPGALDALTDVPGVMVGHATLADGPLQTGVTMIVPHPGNLFLEKVPAAARVLNGFGKTIGLMQLVELGALESPIALTNTFSVGTVSTALIRRAVTATPEIGRSMSTVNPVVAECNDGYLNDLAAFAVSDVHCDAALATAGTSFERGSIGAGRGMTCFGMKGGIGTSSRVATLDGMPYTLGALALANFGRAPQFTLAGRRIGPALAARLSSQLPAHLPDLAPAPERGSIIVVLATDAPVDARQLGRIAFRAGAGIARTGSNFGHGSGDVVIAFSIADRIPERAVAALRARHVLAEPRLERLFDAAAEATEQAILDALFSAVTVIGRDGHVRRCLVDVAPDWATLPA